MAVMEEVSLEEAYCHMMDRSLYPVLLKLYVHNVQTSDADEIGETGNRSCFELPTRCSRFRVRYNVLQSRYELMIGTETRLPKMVQPTLG